MSAANKAKGSLFERQIEDYINSQGLPARRLPRAGSRDIGDVAVTLGNGHVLVLELKNVAVSQMAEFLRQAEVEAQHYDDKYTVQTYGLVVSKARQKPVGEARVTLTLDTLLDFLRWEQLA